VSKEIRREQEKLEENNVENLRKNEHLRFIGCRLVTNAPNTHSSKLLRLSENGGRSLVCTVEGIQRADDGSKGILNEFSLEEI
jgi:hypothetical protein